MQVSALDVVLAVLCVVVAGVLVQSLFAGSRAGAPSKASAPSPPRGLDAEVLTPTPDAAVAPSAAEARDPEPKGKGLAELDVKGIVTPFVARQEGTPTADGHVRFACEALGHGEAQDRARAFHALMSLRRSVRFFDPRPIPDGVLERCVAAAATAPSGAHLQPWTFVIVRDPAARRAIRAAVEAEERVNYAKRMKKSWVDDVAPLVTALHADGAVNKPYIEEAPGLVVVMEQPFGRGPGGERRTHYYPRESVGIAAGILIAALTNAGLFTLTSTPMGAESAIRESLGRPSNERVFLLMPVGFPAVDATVPYRAPGAERKPLAEVAVVV